MPNQDHRGSKNSIERFREIAAIITAMIVVLLFCGLGIIQVAVFVVTGTSVSFEADYKTALLGLASMMAGYLVGSTGGNQSDNKTNTGKPVPAPTTYTSAIEVTTSQPEKPTA
jgi:hypothetical protein